MENASKALIIAGAILVSILLISIGVMVIQSTGNVQQEMSESMDSSAIQQFNGKWDPYIGSNKSAATCKSLCSAIIASNSNSANDLKVTIAKINSLTKAYTGTTSNSDIAVISANAFKNEETYTITITDTDSNGYYDSVTFTKP